MTENAGPAVYTTDYRPEVYEPFRAVMRKRHGYCGPYRLGIAIGEARSDLPCPYARAHASQSFWQGVEVGLERLVSDDPK